MAIYERLPSEGPRRRYQLKSPVTLEPIGELECMDATDVARALERARKAQPAWAALSFDARAKVLKRCLELVLERQDRIIETVVRETGKTENEARRLLDPDHRSKLGPLQDALQALGKRIVVTVLEAA